MTLFKNKYRIESARMRAWDYTSPGWYFVTICTRDRECFLSDVVEGRVVLKPAGIVANAEWLETARIRPNIEIDEYVVMPNHIHGILHFWDPGEIKTIPGPIPAPVPGNETPHRGVSTIPNPTANIHPAPVPSHPQRNPINWKPGVLGAVIGQYKNAVKKQVRRTVLPCFDWQSRFHDHIIRDEKELYYIRKYIRDNPGKWARDRNNGDAQTEMTDLVQDMKKTQSGSCAA